jgi:hypothetical protein
MALSRSINGGFSVKRLTRDGPTAQNGMVKIGDSLVSVSGESVCVFVSTSNTYKGMYRPYVLCVCMVRVCLYLFLSHILFTRFIKVQPTDGVSQKDRK